MRVLTPLLLVGCLIPGMESFTGLAPARVMQRQRQVASFPTASSSSRPRRHGADVMILAAKSTAAAPAETRVDPSVVEAALVEEDKNV